MRPHHRHHGHLLVLLLLLAIGSLALPAPAGAEGQAKLPETPTRTFGGLTEWEVRPHAIYMGESACSDEFTGLRWLSYGPTGGRAVGKGRFPHVHEYPDSCSAALRRARPKQVHIVVSRPAYCSGRLMFTRIGWSARGEHSHDITNCL
jgi:hypothetical protein